MSETKTEMDSEEEEEVEREEEESFTKYILNRPSMNVFKIQPQKES